MPVTHSLSRRKALALCVAGSSVPWAAFAQGSQAGGAGAAGMEFPVKPVRLIVPFAPAGSTDILARLLSKHLFPASGQPAVVENVAGPRGNLGGGAPGARPWGRGRRPTATRSRSGPCPRMR